MGKTFLEKILRSTEVEKVYLLLRPKKGIEPKVRMLKIFKDPVSLSLFFYRLPLNNFSPAF